jgi:hypothetical protein
LVARSLAAALADRGVEVAASAPGGESLAEPYVEVVRCFRNETSGWARLRACVPGRTGAVALVDSRDPELQVRALRNLSSRLRHLGVRRFV